MEIPVLCAWPSAPPQALRPSGSAGLRSRPSQRQETTKTQKGTFLTRFDTAVRKLDTEDSDAIRANRVRPHSIEFLKPLYTLHRKQKDPHESTNSSLGLLPDVFVRDGSGLLAVPVLERREFPGRRTARLRSRWMRRGRSRFRTSGLSGRLRALRWGRRTMCGFFIARPRSARTRFLRRRILLPQSAAFPRRR